MTRWKKDENKFTVSISYNDVRGTQCYIPRPILDKLKNPDRITFTVTGNVITVTSGK